MRNLNSVRILLTVVGMTYGLGALDCFSETAPELPVPQKKNWAFTTLGVAPVQSGGRLKPLDSYAREVILFETGSRSFKNWKPVDLLLSWIAHPDYWDSQELIRVTRDDVRRQLGLDLKRNLFTPIELFRNTNLIQYAEEINAKAVSGPANGSPPAGPMTKADPREQELKLVLERIGLFHNIISGQGWLVVPKPAPAAWSSLVDSDPEGHLIRHHFVDVLKSYQANESEAFERNSLLLTAAIEGEIPGYQENQKNQIAAESLYNRTRPFFYAWVGYLVASLIWMASHAASRVRLKATLEKIALTVTLAAVLSQVYGIALRCFIAGRPPVTNMYESVIWVSFGIMVFAGVLYVMHRQAVIFTVGTALAMFALIAGDSAPAILDPSLHPLVPVLRSNYWLTIHVLTITLGYAAFALTLGLSNISLFHFLKKKSKATSQKIFGLNQLSYRSMQFGVVLIAAGTILGGVWADYSWGRFWGWDPKEVWALITLLCYLVILHGRFTNWVGQFGFAAWSAVSFMSVVMAWYGVNFVLGAGLHSYGFSTGGTPWVIAFVSLQLLYVLVVTIVHMKRQTQAKS